MVARIGYGAGGVFRLVERVAVRWAVWRSLDHLGFGSGLVIVALVVLVGLLGFRDRSRR
ncbi:MAG TPA: hypothetical protein VHT30_01480 [Acidimicrobiales bacterium]|jgi:hypothetical protein|nr:hypothetical protein [Acidimicrobiales bacterium]